jgi:DedD protein
VLGYELGRNQYGGQVRAAADAHEENAPASSAAAEPVKPGGQPGAQPSTTKTPAKSTSATTNAKTAPSAAPPADYDFYKLGQPSQPPAHLTNPSKSSAAQPTAGKNSTPTGTGSEKSAAVKAQPAPAKPANAPAPAPAMNAPLVPHGSFMLQVAALTKESDALALAQALQKKKFPALILTPGADRFYHVQVGPYPDAKAADAARKALDEAGFKAIVKH